MTNILVGNETSAVSGTSGNDVFMSDVSGQYTITGKHVLSGGAGDDAYRISSNTIVVENPGEGIDLIISSDSYKLPDNVESLMAGGFGAVGNDMSNVIIGHSGANSINGGKGDDLLTGGGGADTYQFDAVSGHDTISDWNAGSIIRIGGYSQFHDLSDVQKAMTQVGNDVILRFDAQDDVKIVNTKIADFNSTNFQYKMDFSNLHLSFDDEFNGFSVYQPSQNKDGVWTLWGHDTDVVAGHTLLSNGEKQLYVDPLFKGTGTTALGLNPYFVQDGILNITASPIPSDKQAATYGYQYQSGAITTEGKFAQTYGYFEARLQLPAEKGTWPAFWLMRKDGVWPPELDIMEAWNDTTAVQTVHSQESGHHTINSAGTWIPDGDTAFHNYGFLWTSEKLTWYLDGVEVFSQPTPADMNSPMYMILNLAVSGAVEDPNFNETLKVDYVRAYSLQDLPAGIAPVSPDPTIAVPATYASGAHPYYGSNAGMPDGLNTAYYLATNPDVKAAGVDPIVHYLTYGRLEGRLPYEGAAPLSHDQLVAYGSEFDAAYYLARYPDVRDAGVNAFYHYNHNGQAEGRFPNAAAEAAALASTATTSPVTVTPVVTIPTPTQPVITTPTTTTIPAPTQPVTVPVTPVTVVPTASDHAYWGKNDGVKDGFNAVYYAAHNPDVVASGMNLLYHYDTFGKNEGRLGYDPTDIQTATHHADWGAVSTVTDGFNALYYAAHNPDVVASGMDLLYHYETFGKKEGRAAYDITELVANAASPVLYSGGQTSTTDTSLVDLHDLSASSFHTEFHSLEPITLLGVTNIDQHYGLAA
jgi:beta-glucanase (GH16 family)